MEPVIYYNLKDFPHPFVDGQRYIVEGSKEAANRLFVAYWSEERHKVVKRCRGEDWGFDRYGDVYRLAICPDSLYAYLFFSPFMEDDTLDDSRIEFVLNYDIPKYKEELLNSGAINNLIGSRYII